jgi:hypothetical protein
MAGSSGAFQARGSSARAAKLSTGDPPYGSRIRNQTSDSSVPYSRRHPPHGDPSRAGTNLRGRRADLRQLRASLSMVRTCPSTRRPGGGLPSWARRFAADACPLGFVGFATQVERDELEQGVRPRHVMKLRRRTPSKRLTMSTCSSTWVKSRGRWGERSEDDRLAVAPAQPDDVLDAPDRSKVGLGDASVSVAAEHVLEVVITGGIDEHVIADGLRNRASAALLMPPSRTATR